MIVKDEAVEAALNYLAQFPHPVAEAQKCVTTNKNLLDLYHAKAWTTVVGTIGDREAAITQIARYQEILEEITEAEFELAAHKQRIKSCEMIIEIWRSEQANTRAAERVR